MKTILLVLACLTLSQFLYSSDKGQQTPLLRTVPTNSIIYVPGSVQKVCQVTGDTDLEFNQPTMSLTQTRYGLVRADHGYSFEHNGKLFFLFGDTHPTNKFNGHLNSQTDTPRVIDANDAIGFVSENAAGPCLTLDFVTYPSGAYRNPVILNNQGKIAVELRTNESPVSGISDGGKMYVLFSTDNPIDTVSPPAPLGHPASSVLAVSEDDGVTFHYLYKFSPKPGAKFVQASMVRAPDGYIYFYGTQDDTMFRKSPCYIARKPAGHLSDSTAIEYLNAINTDGTPVFMVGEKNAQPIFHDSVPGPEGSMVVSDAMSEEGVEWNPFVHRWVMIYNCLNNTSANPRGIYMRFSERPWGPWTDPQTIFNPVRDSGYCYFMHRAVNAQTPNACDNLCGPDRLADPGGEYGPYFISRFTTGDSLLGTSTFYFTLDTWNPYTQVIMKASIKSSPQTEVHQTEPEIPIAFNLNQNYPNPFNPSTVIEFQTSTKEHVTLKIFDLLGREVATLMDEQKPAGRYSVRFDARTLAGGVYFYRIIAGNFVETKKLTLLK
jgi:hypothetical protein